MNCIYINYVGFNWIVCFYNRQLLLFMGNQLIVILFFLRWNENKNNYELLLIVGLLYVKYIINYFICCYLFIKYLWSNCLVFFCVLK